MFEVSYDLYVCCDFCEWQEDGITDYKNYADMFVLFVNGHPTITGWCSEFTQTPARFVNRYKRLYENQHLDDLTITEYFEEAKALYERGDYVR